MAAILIDDVRTAVAGFGGPITVALRDAGRAPLQWGLTDGWTVLIFWTVAAIVVVGCCVLWFEKDITYKITGATTAASPASNYDNTMSREPAEPERQPTVKT